MNALEGFEVFQSGRLKPFITLRDGYITFSKTAIECLDYAEYVRMYVDKGNRKVAFQVSSNEEGTFVFFRKPKEGRSMLVRISEKKAVRELMSLAHIDTCRNGLRYYGEFIEEQRTIIFDMAAEGIHVGREGNHS